MANGTIAFDTLQTSGQITGTAKSVDTDYVVNGSAKAWINMNGSGTIANRDSFNVSGITDNGTGDFTVTINNDFENANYSVTSHGSRFHANEGDFVIANYYSSAYSDGQTSSINRLFTSYASSQNAFDLHVISAQYLGDLA